MDITLKGGALFSLALIGLLLCAYLEIEYRQPNGQFPETVIVQGLPEIE